MAGLSFKLTKTLERKVLQDSKLRDETTKDVKEALDYIQDVKGNKIIGTIKETSGPLIIPLISKNKWREGDKPKKEKKGKQEKSLPDKDEKDLTVQERAAREILEESRKELQSWEERGEGPQVDQVPLLLSNAVPTGFETEENLDVSLRAEESTLEDYESIPVEQFGMAVLRGMGWRPDEGIGGFNKKVVKTVEPVVRPKGLGLGASKPKQEAVAVPKEGEEKLELKKGAFIRIESGRKAGLYGEVEGFDEENARLMVKLALGNEKISISENIVKVVNAKEYKEWGKILNRDKYEQCKKEKEERSSKQEKVKEEEDDDEVFLVRSRSRSREKTKKKKSRKGYSEEERSRSSSPDVKRYKVSKTWIRPDLRVRCIDKKYKEGRYYNYKVNVIDVVTNERCDCRTDEGRLLEGIRTDMLETVIPRELGSRVMIVQGSQRGEMAELMDKDKTRCRATLRLLTSGQLLQKSYEDICDFIGASSQDLD